jgi:isocitrate/isopropylmalate dehydrogenase
VAHAITFIPGDGPGAEPAEAGRRVLEATGVSFDSDDQAADGAAGYVRVPDPAPPARGGERRNPAALMLSGVLMLRHIEERDAADRMESAIAGVIRRGEKVTNELKPTRNDPSAVGTSASADAVIEEMNE